MKNLFSALCVLSLVACGNNEKKTSGSDEQVTISDSTATKVSAPEIDGYLAYGEEISAQDAISEMEMRNKFQTMEMGDTLQVKFASTATSVCKKEGCWMKVDLGIGEESMVKFNDHAFLVPKDIEGKDVVVKGKAFMKELSVKELQHYAEDAGKSEAEIAAITEPKRSLAFEADGVLIGQ